VLYASPGEPQEVMRQGKLPPWSVLFCLEEPDDDRADSRPRK
jgi:maltooligosyltrehalose trehalohydrolase